jgi:arylsulfatase
MPRRRPSYLAAVLAAVAVMGALVAALVVGLRVAGAQGWWTAGYRRLVVDAVCLRFDQWGLVALGAALACALVAEGVQRGRGTGRLPVGRRAARVAVGVLLAIGGMRAAVAVDAWWVGSGPSLLLVSIDTLRPDHLGAYGSALDTSPVVDRRLAGEGVTFEEVYSQSPKTTPSHMTMLTSLYPSVHGIEMWDDAPTGAVLNPAVHTLAEVLKNAGYATAAFTGGANVHRSRGFDQGFDVYKHGDQLTRATRWLAAHRRRKFFLFFHTYAVHDPYLPEDRDIARFAPDFRGPLLDTVRALRAGGARSWEQAHARFWAAVDTDDPTTVRFVERLYDAAIRGMDESVVAPLLDQLDWLGLGRDTLVVFTSDHGEAFGEHGAFQHNDLYAGTLRVPLILRFPGRLPGGLRVGARARLIDLMPTVLDLLGVAAPPEIEGRSLVPLLHGPSSASEGCVSELLQSRVHRVFQSMRRDGLTYIVDGGVEQLFDLATDPGEVRDLAPTQPDQVASARADLARWRAAQRVLAARLGPAGTVIPDAETVRQLRALGYVQ